MSAAASQQVRVIAVLRGAHARILDPSRWTKGSLARAASGDSAEPCDDAAVCWCALGAIDAEDADERNLAKDLLLRTLEGAYPGLPVDPDEPEPVAAFNDATPTLHGDVLRLFEAAIAGTYAAI